MKSCFAHSPRRVYQLLSLMALLWFAALSAFGTIYYVSPQFGSDANSGTASNTPFLTLQRALDGTTAQKGDTVYLLNGVYRGHPTNWLYAVADVRASGTLSHPITVTPYAGHKAYLKGSVIAGGVGDTNQWALVSTNEIATMGFPGAGYGHIYKLDHWWCDNAGKLKLVGEWSYQSNPQQVFMSNSETNDGVALKQMSWPTSDSTTPVDSRFPRHGDHYPGSSYIYCNTNYTPADFTSGCFYYREVTNNAGTPDISTIYVWLPAGDHPTNHCMEVSVSTWIMRSWGNGPGGEYIKFKDLIFRHSNTASWGEGSAAAINMGFANTLDNCDIQWCDCTALSVGAYGAVTRCNISNHGKTGFGMGDNSLMDSCYISGNNYRVFGWGYHSGGGKTIGKGAGSIIQNSEFTRNNGNAIWFDFIGETNSPPTIVRHNYIHDNRPVTQWQGLTNSPPEKNRSIYMIFLEACRNIYVYNNLIISNTLTSIKLDSPDGCQVFNNIIMQMDSDNNGDGTYNWFNIRATDGWRDMKNTQVYYNLFLYNTNGLAVIRTNDSALSPMEYNLWDYNIYYNPGVRGLRFQDGNYHGPDHIQSWWTFKFWQQVSGMDAHSLELDPQLVGPFDMQYALSDFGSIIAGAMQSHEASESVGMQTQVSNVLYQLDNKLDLAGGTITGNLAVGGQLRLANGSASAPALAFSSDTDTGIFRNSANEIGFATGGVGRWYIDSLGILWSDSSLGISNPGQFAGADGSASAPTYTFISGNPSGLYHAYDGSLNDQLRFSTASTDRMKVTKDSVEMLQGARVVGGLTNDNLTASRVVTSGANKQLASSSVTTTELGYLSGVTSALQTQLDNKVNVGGGSLSGALVLPNGSLGSPSLSFTGDSATGLYLPATGKLGVAGGMEVSSDVTINRKLTVTNTASGLKVVLSDYGTTPIQAFGGGFQAVMGDNNNANTGKEFRLGMPDFDPAMGPKTVAAGFIYGTNWNELYFGGGTAWGQAFQSILFYTGPAPYPGVGTRAMSIDADGNVLIGNMGGTGRGNLAVEGKTRLLNLTASRVLISDGLQYVTNSAVTTTELGYLSGVSSGVQSQLDGKTAETVATVQTTDATTTTLTTVTAANGETIQVNAWIIGVQSSSTNAAGYVASALFVKSGGTVRQVGATTAISTQEDVSAWNATLDTDGSNIRVRVTGAASSTVNWKVRYQITKL